MIQCEPSNIFVPRNDWNVKALMCKSKLSHSSFIERVGRIIKDETGYSPFETTEFRKREFVFARQLLMSILANNTSMSLMKIGYLLKKDHATVVHAKKTILNLYETDPVCRDAYDRIIKKVQLLTMKR